jgi:hypothetical protein
MENVDLVNTQNKDGTIDGSKYGTYGTKDGSK